MKAIYSGCIPDPWLDVAKKLYLENKIEPVYWIGWNDCDKKLVLDNFETCIFQTFQMAWKGILPSVDKANTLNIPELDGDILKKFSHEENLAMKMMDRQDPTGYNFSFVERQVFFRYLLRNWIYIIERYDIGLVISPSIPHRVFDFALYIASQIKNINFITFKQTVWPGYIIPMKKIDEIPFYTQTQTKSNEIVEKYITKIKSNYLKAEPDYMKAQKKNQSSNNLKLASNWIKKRKFINSLVWIFKDSNSYWKIKGKEIQESRISNFQKQLILLKGRKYKKKLKRNYELRSSKPDYSHKFIFVALHYQPEETSNPSGGIYVDQLLMVETLLKYSSNDTYLYIKEHTSQFHPLMEGETGRQQNFYKRLLEFERVKLISTEVNSFDLIDNSMAVVTLTGTVGVESVIRHKPVIVFGTAWYEHLTGVFKIRTMEDLVSALVEIENGVLIEDDSINKSLTDILNNTVKAYHYGNNKILSGISKEESVSNLVSCILSLINQ